MIQGQPLATEDTDHGPAESARTESSWPHPHAHGFPDRRVYAYHAAMIVASVPFRSSTLDRMRRRAAVVTIVCGVVGLAACRGPQSALDPAGPAAEAIVGIWWLMFWSASAVLVLVMTLVLYAMLRRPQAEPLQRPERFIVAGGLVLPTVALLALLIHGTSVGGRVIGLGVETDRVIAVTARQWQWQFDHLDANGAVLATAFDHLVLPRGEMVEFHIDSEDVIHSFWIPRLGGKIDAIPGRSNRLRLRADQAGPMRGQCAEFCGLGHAHMHFGVDVLEPAAYQAWLADPSPMTQDGAAR